jgi:hypothetical protein
MAVLSDEEKSDEVAYLRAMLSYCFKPRKPWLNDLVELMLLKKNKSSQQNNVNLRDVNRMTRDTT